MVVLNTFSKLPARCLYICKSPADRPDLIIGNQIDFMHTQFQNTFTTFDAGTEIQSDHAPLFDTAKFKLKKNVHPNAS